MTEYKYAEPQTYLLVNEDDPNLDTIRIDLPPCPPLETIDGYGLPPKQQMWKAPEVPHRLKALEKKFPTISEIKDYLTEHQVEYQEEIEWIQLQWHRRLNGYWFFNNGVPTYIDGWHYFYIGFWKIDVGLPKYRDRDRVFFIFARYCYTTTKTPDGTEYGKRICYGFNYPKYRQEGSTYKAGCLNFCVVTEHYNFHGGIQSMDGNSAKKTFKKAIVAPFKKLPFFFKPVYDSSADPSSELSFDIPVSKKAGMAFVETGLESKIDYATTAKRGFFDGDTLGFYHQDEIGKTCEENVYQRWQVVRKACGLGGGSQIRALVIGTSTVGEMSEQGGAAFFELCKNSSLKTLNDFGLTETGLWNLFIPSYIGMPGFIDKFGNSVVEDPKETDRWRLTDIQRDSNGRLVGARRFLTDSRERILLEETATSNENYEEEVRQMPLEFSECFITKGAGSGLNLKKILIRIKQIQFDDMLTKRVTYEWEKDFEGKPIRFGKVIQRLDQTNGEWVISLDLPAHQTNQRTQEKWFNNTTQTLNNSFAPATKNKFTLSADTFKFSRVQGKRLSMAAASIFWERDEQLDPDSKPMYAWESYRSVATYVGRPPTKNDFAEKCLMAAIYWGAEVFPEIDIPVVWDFLEENGYHGYLKYGSDILGKKKKTPGFNARASQQEMFLATRDYIEIHCERIRHLEILESYKSIKGIEDLTNQDLFVAVAGSLMGSKYKVTEFKKTKAADISSYFPAKTY